MAISQKCRISDYVFVEFVLCKSPLETGDAFILSCMLRFDLAICDYVRDQPNPHTGKNSFEQQVGTVRVLGYVRFRFQLYGATIDCSLDVLSRRNKARKANFHKLELV